MQAQYIFIHKAIAEVIEEDLPTQGNDEGPIYANSKWFYTVIAINKCVCVCVCVWGSENVCESENVCVCYYHDN